MDVDKKILLNIMKPQIRDNWIKLINKRLDVIKNDNDIKEYYEKRIVILYEPDITSMDFRSIFDKTFDCYPISIEEYIKKKLRNFNLINYEPRLKYCKDPIKLSEPMVKIYLKYNKFNEFEIITFNEWESIVSSGVIGDIVDKMNRNFSLEAIIHTDYSIKDLVRHEIIFYEIVKKGQMSIYQWIISKLKSIHATYLIPFCEYVDNPHGLDTKVFRFGVTRNKKDISPRFIKSFKTSK